MRPTVAVRNAVGIGEDRREAASRETADRPELRLPAAGPAGPVESHVTATAAAQPLARKRARRPGPAPPAPLVALQPAESLPLASVWLFLESYPGT